MHNPNNIKSLPLELAMCSCLKGYGLLDLIPCEIYLIEPVTWRYYFANDTACRNVQYSPQELTQLNAVDLGFGLDLISRAEAALRAAPDQSVRFEFQRRRKDGSSYPAETCLQLTDINGLSLIVSVVTDLTERREIERRMKHQALFDSLTGLPNRALFNDRLMQALARSQRNQNLVALMFLDLDKFKEVNDTLGHDKGDRVLCQAAARMRNCLRKEDALARLAGDEFTIILEGITTQEQVSRVAEKIIHAFEAPFIVDGFEFFLTVSIGIAFSPTGHPAIDEEALSNLLKQADTAMYRAKESGRNACQFYSAEVNARSMARVDMKNQLQHALERNELFLQYQPQVRADTGDMIGCEALLRWQHPRFGLVPPVKFIELAEENGLVIPIGAWVLETACRQNKAWQDAGLPPVRMAVNLSARQLKHAALIEDIQAILQRTGLAPQYLELEITEGMLIENIESGRQVLTDLKAMGVSIALDDFGTGYSSLSYLRDLPLDVLKMDGSFTRRGLDQRSGAIMSAIIEMAHALELKVIAEGVETEMQLGQLKARACDYLQGYLFSRPIDAGVMTRLLARCPMGAAQTVNGPPKLAPAGSYPSHASRAAGSNGPGERWLNGLLSCTGPSTA